MEFGQLFSLLLLIFGFGFVIFFHELGHFLAAKWVGIKVEQFAVGFGHALLSWRKGFGFKLGSSARKYEELAARNEAAGIGETEYRLNWIPLGGYVKMTGQDDLRPNAEQDDPRAYNKKSIGARMIVVSAGVVMNIILAAAGFMIVFRTGFNTQPPIAGMIQPLSPAALTTTTDGKLSPVDVGDRLLMLDGKWLHSFDKIQLNVALADEGKLVLLVKRRDGREERLLITPAQSEGEGSDFLMIGVGPIMQLKGVDPEKIDKGETLSQILAAKDPLKLVPRDFLAIQPGDVITQVNGQDVKVDEFWKLDHALQQSNGQPVTLTVRGKDGKTRQESIRPKFMRPFAGELDIAGMSPRTTIAQVQPTSSALDKLLPEDIVLRLTFQNGGDTVHNPTVAEFRKRLEQAGQTGQPMNFLVLRDGKEVEVTDLKANVKIAKGVYGLNVAPAYDQEHAVVASTEKDSPAGVAGIPSGATLTSLNGQPVKNWFDVRRLLAAAAPDQPIAVAAQTANGPKTYELHLSSDQITRIAGLQYVSGATHLMTVLDPRIEPRKTDKLSTAAAWGVTETRDFILQFYVTLHRMFQGRVSYKNMMGPLGIFNAGRHFADRGTDWLIWFLAMISANLAVVNFLPIPIVDGGLFTFLIVEKIQGRPLSAKTQSIAQFVGLAIILSVFLLVTYQDIARLWF